MTEPIDYEIQDVERYYRQDHALEIPIDWAQLSMRRVLYVGCGRAEALRFMGSNSMGVDFNAKLLPLWESLGLRCVLADARSLPFKDGEFGATFSCDFLEHVKPDDIPAVYGELLRVAPAGVHWIDALVQSGHRGEGGKNLHPSGSMSREAWQAAMPGATVTSAVTGHHHMAVWGWEYP